jgi:hypothetical protein
MTAEHPLDEGIGLESRSPWNPARLMLTVVLILGRTRSKVAGVWRL